MCYLILFPIFIELEQQSHEKNIISVPCTDREINGDSEVRWLAQGHTTCGGRAGVLAQV